MLIERVVNETDRPLVIADDALGLMKHDLKTITQRRNTLIVTDMVGLIKAAGPLDIPIHIRRDGGLNNRVEINYQYLGAAKASYVVSGPDIMTGSAGQVSVTPYDIDAAYAAGVSAGVMAVFWAQNQANTFEGIATAAFVLAKAAEKTENKTAQGLSEAIAKVIEQF
jgi:hypothetical protein